MTALELDIEQIRKDFPILNKQVNGKPLIYFDNGATTQKPKQVIDAIVNYYTNNNANIHRGVHTLSQQATVDFEKGRVTVQKHLNAAHPEEIIFTKGTTESINLIASCMDGFVDSGSEILISHMEHHSNILPWQELCKRTGATLKVIPINNNGELIFDEFKKLFSEKTKVVALCHVSNTLGTINPIKEVIHYIRGVPSEASAKDEGGVFVCIDGAQAVPHMKVDVQNLDADFYSFSAHKCYGPTGIGILYGKKKWLDQLPPYQTGGGTIKTVTFEKTVYTDAPLKFEAGTPDMAGVAGLTAALNYMNEVGLDAIKQHEKVLLNHTEEQLKKIEKLRLIGSAEKKAGVLSFVIDGLHPLDIGTLLDKQGVAVRTGHHCTQPLMDRFGVPGTVRVSFGIYNTKQEVDVFIKALEKTIKMLK